MTGLIYTHTGLAKTVLGHDFALDEPLMAAGLDSLGAVELRNAVAEAFGVSLPATAALDLPTLEAMAAHVEARLVPSAATSLQAPVRSHAGA